jgi:hypothetical protein
MGRGAEKKINGRIERRPFCSMGGAFSQPMPCQGSIGSTVRMEKLKKSRTWARCRFFHRQRISSCTFKGCNPVRGMTLPPGGLNMGLEVGSEVQKLGREQCGDNGSAKASKLPPMKNSY